MNGTLRRFLSVLYPETCVCCGEPVSSGRTVCPDCEQKLPRVEPPYCPFCGISLSDCRCRKRPRAYAGVIAPYYYEGPVRDAILRMKYGGREEAARFLAEALSRRVRADYFGIPFDLVTCIPTTRAKLAQRGFNQAESIASAVFADCFPGGDVVFDRSLLKKKSGGQMQHLLDASGRRRNVRGTLRISGGRDVRGKTILLIDDIVTTGATAEESAAVLCLSGAAAVYIACAALTRNTGPQYAKSKEDGRSES